MGNPSFLRFVPAQSATVPIDWTKIPDASKEYFLDTGYCVNQETYKPKPLPETIGHLAEMFDECKFFSYMKPKLIELLLDIGEFGLGPKVDHHVTPTSGYPRFYMTQGLSVWFLIFTLGRRDTIMGSSPSLPDNFEEDYDEDRESQKEKAIAEKFDIEFCKDNVQWNAIGVGLVKKVAGWDASTLKNALEDSQYCEAIMTLPLGHPALVAIL